MSPRRSPINWRLAVLLLVALGGLAQAEQGEPPIQFTDEENCAELLGEEPLVAAGARADAELVQPDSTETDPDEAALPTEWEPAQGRQCHRYRGRMVCEGPRKVPVAQGEAAERAERLGLGTRQAAGTLLRGPPPPEWVAVAQEREDTSTTLHWPVDDGRLWRHYGLVRNHRGRRRLHKGVDIGGSPGALIRAVRQGLVVYSYNGLHGYGNTMLILHADATVALYGHCQANYVFAGQLVDRGQAIGEVGATGLAHGAHLHFELRKAGRPFNPYPLFEGKAPSGAEQTKRRAGRLKGAAPSAHGPR